MRRGIMDQIEFTRVVKGFVARFDSQKEAAKALGLSTSAVSRYLQGTTPRFSTALDVLAKIKAKKGGKK